MNDVEHSTEGRVAVVTGGAGAIGTAIVEALRQSGHTVVVLDRTGEVACDLSSEESTRAAAEEVLSQYQRCDVLVHCATVFDPMPLADFDVARWRKVQAVNVESPLLLARALTPRMIEHGFGRIVFVASNTVWLQPAEVFLPYVASKGAMIGAMRTLALELGPHGIGVTAVAPGLTDTPASRAVNRNGEIEAVVETQAMKRPLVPEDTARIVAFLCSEAAEPLTGQVVVADGGIVKR